METSITWILVTNAPRWVMSLRTAFYCGDTQHHLHTRYCVHKGTSNRTGLHLKNPFNSHIRNHAELCNHHILMTDFKVATGYSREDLKLAEAIYIRKDSP